jgi:hypothetical protein
VLYSGRRSAGARRKRWLRLALCLLSLSGCGPDRPPFSQYPGFREWFAGHKPAETLPSPTDQALLARYRPRLFLPSGQEGPISFYDDYIPHGTLVDGGGKLVSTAVTRGILNAHKADPGAVFSHRRGPETPRPVVLGRIDRERVLFPGEAAPREFTFLGYNVVFRVSGLPAGIPGWQRFLLGLVADTRDWHQLDHYTAVTIALMAEGADLVPVAAIFQQHNYLRSYLLGRRETADALTLPPDGHLTVDVAESSNELYPHRPGRQRRRAVSFLDAKSIGYLVNGTDPPFLAADDITDPAREAPYELGFLPPADAFYVFQGRLGERRRLPGRDGPPGADYNTLPAFKPKATEMMLFRWSEGNAAQMAALRGAFGAEGERPSTPDLTEFARRFLKDLKCARAAECGGPSPLFPPGRGPG